MSWNAESIPEQCLLQRGQESGLQFDFDALDIHLAMDYYGTHKYAKVKRWLAARPRYHVHFTPTYTSWLN
jgi:hypothetical protein